MAVGDGRKAGDPGLRGAAGGRPGPPLAGLRRRGGGAPPPRAPGPGGPRPHGGGLAPPRAAAARGPAPPPPARAARRGELVARSGLLRRLVFGPFLVADPAGLTEAAVEGFLGAQLLHTDVRSAWHALRRDDPRLDLERVRCPALVLWGSEDAQLPLDDAFEYARRLRAPVRTIADCGHLLIGERPAACADAIENFLDGVRELEERPREAEPL